MEAASSLPVLCQGCPRFATSRSTIRWKNLLPSLTGLVESHLELSESVGSHNRPAKQLTVVDWRSGNDKTGSRILEGVNLY
jgi:hypothetical protein